MRSRIRSTLIFATLCVILRSRVSIICVGACNLCYIFVNFQVTPPSPFPAPTTITYQPYAGCKLLLFMYATYPPTPSKTLGIKGKQTTSENVAEKWELLKKSN